MENTFLILRIDREKRELFHKAAKELNSDATKILTKKIDYIINKSKALETK